MKTYFLLLSIGMTAASPAIFGLTAMIYGNQYPDRYIFAIWGFPLLIVGIVLFALFIFWFRFMVQDSNNRTKTKDEPKQS